MKRWYYAALLLALTPLYAAAHKGMHAHIEVIEETDDFYSQSLQGQGALLQAWDEEDNLIGEALVKSFEAAGYSISLEQNPWNLGLTTELTISLATTDGYLRLFNASTMPLSRTRAVVGRERSVAGIKEIIARIQVVSLYRVKCQEMAGISQEPFPFKNQERYNSALCLEPIGNLKNPEKKDLLAPSK